MKAFIITAMPILPGAALLLAVALLLVWGWT